MDTTVPTRSRPRPVPRAARVTIALAAALLAGVLTSAGQAVPALATVANAAGPWFVVAVGLLLVARLRLGWSTVAGVVLLGLMHVGYWAASNLGGHPDTLALTNVWVLLALPAGLLAGAVAVLLRSSDGRRRGVATGAAAAVLVGEGVRALLQVADTTGSTGWTVEIAVGVLVLAAGVLTAESAVGRVVALAVGVVGTAGVLGAYLLVGGA